MKSKIDYYLDIAREIASRSTCIRKQYGAILVKNDEIIASGYNGSPRGEANCSNLGVCARAQYSHGEGYDLCRAVHAEQNAIISASRQEMLDSTLYLACMNNGVEVIGPEPCIICRRLIKNAGIKQVITRKGVITL